MAEKETNIQLEAIKAMFETGKIAKMSQLDKLSPTFIAKSLKINYGRYISKLYKPELFVVSELNNLAKLIDVKLRIIMDIVVKEIDR